MLFSELPVLTVTSPYASLVPWVVFFPLVGLLLNLLIGKWIGEAGVGLVASLASGLAFGVAVLLAIGLSGAPEVTIIHFLDWITIGDLQVSWAFRVDTLSVTMMLVVAGVGTLIHIYAIGYMHLDTRHNEDPGRFRRFFVYLNLFIAAMMILVSADNYLMLFVGWEGVGLCSYLLIGFWFEKGAGGIANAKAAKKAFVVNRIGDFGLLIALFFMFWNFKSFQFDAVFEQVEHFSPWVIQVITLFMLLGVTGKSAQIPLYVWLPDAMAGPTPVSALIHAATMVTAGVYLVARSHALYGADPLAQSLVAWIGALTAIFAATIAVGQNDIKRVLAYSTISQLGFMVAAVGMGAFVAGIFHLITHAFFKALLFLSAGSVILGMEHGQEVAYGGHAHPAPHGKPKPSHVSPAEENSAAHAGFDPQDMRNMGGLRARMRTTFVVYLIGALALAGIAPLSGFFSKDEILAAAIQFNPALFALLLAAAFLTAFYMWRQITMVFLGPSRTRAAGAAAENKPVITVPLIILALLSFFGGALNLPGVLTLEHWLEHTIEMEHVVAFNPLVAASAFILALAGIALAYAFYGRQPAARSSDPDPLQIRLAGWFDWLAQAWKVDAFYNTVLVGAFRRLASFLAYPVDQDFIDGIVNGLGSLSLASSQWLRQFQTGFVRSYALIVVLGVVAILTYLVWFGAPLP